MRKFLLQVAEEGEWEGASEKVDVTDVVSAVAGDRDAFVLLRFQRDRDSEHHPASESCASQIGILRR